MSNLPKIKHLESNSELDNFYNNIIKKVKNLMTDENYQEALSLINEELEQPYIPLKFYDSFHELKYDILTTIYHNKIEEKYWTKTPEQLINLIANSNTFIAEYWDVFLDKIEIEEKSINDYCIFINNVFLSNKIHNVDKLYLISTMIELGVNYEFDFKNSYSNAQAKINPSTIENEMKNSKYTKVTQNIYDLFMKDITKYNFSINILNYTQDYYFPEFPFESVESLTRSIINYVENVMNGSDSNSLVNNKDDELVYKAVSVLCQ